MNEEIQTELESIIASFDCTLYDVSFIKENNNHIVRISIIANDKQTTLDKCRLVSEAISPLLDVKDILPHAYVLEVSSPGIERILKTPRHFKLSLGERVSVRLMDRSEFEGVLDSADENGVVIIVDNGESEGGYKSITYRELKKVKTIFEW